MKKRITTILLTFAIAITGINAPADKANAETKEAKTTTETTAEAPTATPAPVTGDIRGNYTDGYEIYNGTEWEKLVRNGIYYDWSGGSLYHGGNGWEKPGVGEYRGDTPDTFEKYTEDGWKKVEWKLGDRWHNELIYTPTGWKPVNDESIREANEAVEAKRKDEEAKKPRDIRINTRVNLISEENTTRLEDGDTTEITKGFDTEISFKATGDTSPNWTSSNPDAVTIAKTTQNKDRKTAVLTGKNYGTSVVTAEYNGYKMSITVKVMKNEYKRNEPDSTGGSTYVKKKERGLSHVREVFVTAKYNKKGNLVVTYTEKTSKWKNPKDKRKIVYKGKPYVSMKDENGKTVVKRYVGKFKMTLSPKKKTGKFTFTVPKKYLKKKSVDLRKCKFFVYAYGKYSKDKIAK